MPLNWWMIAISKYALFEAACRFCFDFGRPEFFLSFAHLHCGKRLAYGVSVIALSSLDSCILLDPRSKTLRLLAGLSPARCGLK